MQEITTDPAAVVGLQRPPDGFDYGGLSEEFRTDGVRLAAEVKRGRGHMVRPRVRGAGPI